MEYNNIQVYTDGSSLGNPGPGGWGFIVVSNKELGFKNDIEIGGGQLNTTNNRMELQAVIECLKYFKKSNLNIKELSIFADSNYVILGITSWVYNWEKNGWKTANKKEVLNQDLWKELLNLVINSNLKIKWEKVKGHSGHIYNDRVDEIARSYASKQKRN